MSDVCVNHPDLPAIEQCEVCGDQLCGLCLWYTADGHRLCETHAAERELAGETVLPPDTYREALANSLRRKEQPDAAEAGGEKVYKGNSYDLAALVAAIVGVIALFSCFGGVYCLPVIGMGLAAITLLNADRSVDGRRTRNLSIAGLAFSGALIIALLAICGLYVASLSFVFLTAGSVGP